MHTSSQLPTCCSQRARFSFSLFLFWKITNLDKNHAKVFSEVASVCTQKSCVDGEGKWAHVQLTNIVCAKKESVYNDHDETNFFFKAKVISWQSSCLVTIFASPQSACDRHVRMQESDKQNSEDRRVQNGTLILYAACTIYFIAIIIVFELSL